MLGRAYASDQATTLTYMYFIELSAKVSSSLSDDKMLMKVF